MDWIVMIREKLYGKPVFFEPLASGGEQISVRFAPNIVDGCTELAKKLGWSRNEVISTLLLDALSKINRT